MIRLRLTCIPADLALIAGRERFSRAGFRGVPSCPVYPAPAAVCNAGSAFAGQGGRLLPTARRRRDYGGTGSPGFRGLLCGGVPALLDRLQKKTADMSGGQLH